VKRRVELQSGEGKHGKLVSGERVEAHLLRSLVATAGNEITTVAVNRDGAAMKDNVALVEPKYLRHQAFDF
jgi:hypothetical protein